MEISDSAVSDIYWEVKLSDFIVINQTLSDVSHKQDSEQDFLKIKPWWIILYFLFFWVG